MSFFSDLLGGSSSGSGGTDWGSIGSALAGIGLGLFGDQNDLPNDVEDILDRQEGSIDALTNPDHPQFLALSKSLEADKISSFAEGIRQYQTALQRGSLRGSVMPERRDEGISQAFGRARQSAGEEARAQARQYLAQAAGLNNAAMGSFPTLMQQQQNENMATMGGIGAAGDLISLLLANRGSPQTVVNLGGNSPMKPTIRSSYGSANAASYSDPTRYYG